jgi:hypothetical protein
MEHYAALILGSLSEGDADASDSMCPRGFQVRQLQALLVDYIEVVMQVKVEPRHHLPKRLPIALVPFLDLGEPSSRNGCESALR